ncbi:MAG: 1-deoxy-D-xylulose-5-phosphate reductoisomerase [Verrucomicrobia bacterium]|nr:1-deoxy-D-xylulose-5-phosphate reductoisomerase [Verrucomicrobiota bacterium]
MRKRRVVILGATGSIGQSALKVARDIPDRMEIVGMSAHTNEKALAAAAKDFPGARCVRTHGPDGLERLIELATMPEADLVLVAIVGTAGLRPALAAIEAGKDLAVASKEILVMAGEAVMQAAAETGVRILPVDSEHNAIFQCIEGRDISSIKRLILTCSGGPFRDAPRKEFDAITPERALRHPTWQMGRKISIDSATLFNKALEMIEARWLFGLPISQVEVVVHPQSIIHSMVEFVDGSTLAQMSHSDMCFPIHYAVTWPDRVPNSLRPLDFAALGRLDFESPRRDDFPALDLAVEAGTRGGTLPAVLNAANEIAVDAFLAGKIRFPKIWEIVAKVMAKCPHIDHPGLEQVIETDRAARALASRLVLE